MFWSAHSSPPQRQQQRRRNARPTPSLTVFSPRSRTSATLPSARPLTFLLSAASVSLLARYADHWQQFADTTVLPCFCLVFDCLLPFCLTCVCPLLVPSLSNPNLAGLKADFSTANPTSAYDTAGFGKVLIRAHSHRFAGKSQSRSLGVFDTAPWVVFVPNSWTWMRSRKRILQTRVSRISHRQPHCLRHAFCMLMITHDDAALLLAALDWEPHCCCESCAPRHHPSALTSDIFGCANCRRASSTRTSSPTLRPRRARRQPPSRLSRRKRAARATRRALWPTSAGGARVRSSMRLGASTHSRRLVSARRTSNLALSAFSVPQHA